MAWRAKPILCVVEGSRQLRANTGAQPIVYWAPSTELEWNTGFEPATFALARRDSTGDFPENTPDYLVWRNSRGPLSGAVRRERVDDAPLGLVRVVQHGHRLAFFRLR